MRRPVLACLALLAAPAAASADPVLTIEARGNPVLGGLAFAPKNATAKVGDEVAWVNRDFVVPHNAVEKHGLWSVSGTYGATPISPPGFAPGAVVPRTFEAGTHEYLCTVHPQDMTGTVAVPVELEAERRRVRRARTRKDRRRARSISDVIVRWSSDPVEGQAFDAQRRRPGGKWVTVAKAATEATGRFRTTPGTTWEVRARLRSAKGGEQATGWSPPATVTG